MFEKLLLKSNLTDCSTPIVSSFPSFDASNFHQLVNESSLQLGQISSPFCILYDCAKARLGGKQCECYDIKTLGSLLQVNMIIWNFLAG